MSSFPRLVRTVPRSGQVRYSLGHRLVDRYLEFVAGWCRPNTLRAVAFDLKAFFTVVAKDLAAVTASDVLISSPSNAVTASVVRLAGRGVAVVGPDDRPAAAVGVRPVLAAGAGITFGVLDALTKSTVDLLAGHGTAALARWEPYGLLAAGIVGALLSQNAFQAGALSVSLPVIDSLEPVSAVIIAAAMFGEWLAASPGQLAAQLAGGAAAAAGIAALSRSAVAAMEIAPSNQPPGPPAQSREPGPADLRARARHR